MSDAFQIVVQTAAAPVAKNGKPESAALSARLIKLRYRMGLMELSPISSRQCWLQPF
jgi:hypothetical protein